MEIAILKAKAALPLALNPVGNIGKLRPRPAARMTPPTGFKVCLFVYVCVGCSGSMTRSR
jgi:hypothetical protein